MNIGRNDACPCGSGKKYKKCCGHHSVISLNDLVAKEVVDLQKQITNYAITNYKEEIEQFLDNRLKNAHVPEEFMEAYSFLMVNWYISTNKENGKAIVERFIDQRLHTVKRPRVQSILKSWVDAKPAILKVKQSENNQLQTEDLFTNEPVTVLTFNEARHVPTDSIVIGITIPYEDQVTFYTLYLDIPPTFAPTFIQTIETWMEQSGTQNPTEYIMNSYPEIVKYALVGEEGPLHQDEIEWSTEAHKEIAQLMEEKVAETLDPKLAVPVGISLWYDYCEKENPRPRNKGVYAGALHLLIEKLVSPTNVSTYKQMGELYDASASSISSRMKQMEEVLKDSIEKWNQKLEDVKEPVHN